MILKVVELFFITQKSHRPIRGLNMYIAVSLKKCSAKVLVCISKVLVLYNARRQGGGRGLQIIETLKIEKTHCLVRLGK